MYDLEKACIYASGTYFELKNVCIFLICLPFLKNQSLIILDRTVYDRDAGVIVEKR
jgi:hypothetical protein